MPRGRPRKCTESQFISTLVLWAKQIYKNGAVVVKTDPVWKKLSEALENHYQPESLYALVTDNRWNVLDAIKEELNEPITTNLNKPIRKLANESKRESDEESDYLHADDSMNASNDNDVYNRRSIEFDVLIKKEKFNEITNIVEYSVNTREASTRKRKYLKFKKGVWQAYFNEQIWTNTAIKCGFNYKDHHLALNGMSGYFEGKYFLDT